MKVSIQKTPVLAAKEAILHARKMGMNEYVAARDALIDEGVSPTSDRIERAFSQAMGNSEKSLSDHHIRSKNSVVEQERRKIHEMLDF